MSIATELAYLGFEASDLDAWERLATEVLGLVLAECPSDGTLVLRLDDRAQRIVIHPGPEDDLVYAGFKTGGTAELKTLVDSMRTAGITVTEPMKDDMEAIFAPVKQLDRNLPFEIEVTDWLKSIDPAACQPSLSGGGCSSAPTGCGVAGLEGATPMLKIMKRRADGSLLPVELNDSIDLGAVARHLAQNADGSGQIKLKMEDLKAMGLVHEDVDLESIEGRGEIKMLAIGTSDHAPFLDAGLPGLWWNQRGDDSVEYAAHSERDTRELVIPRYLEHSATVIALAALGTANLDHLLSREKLTDPDEAPAATAGEEQQIIRRCG